MVSPPPPAQMSDVMPPPNRSSQGAQRVDNIFCMSTPFDACVLCNACFILPERTNMVELHFGKYHGTITEPGCYCRNTLATELRRVATDLVTYDLQNTKVIDERGSPVVISGIITYEVVDARRAAIDVSDAHRFVRDQAPAVLKRVVSQFPYEAEEPDVSTLRNDTQKVGNLMRDALQERVVVAGVRVEAFSINELSYAPEIAQTMLRRQQAEALVAARKEIVKGAKEIAREAVADIGEGMSEEQRGNLLGNLLVVLVGDKDVTPTLQV